MMFRKLVLAASIVLGLPLSLSQAGVHVGVGMEYPLPPRYRTMDRITDHITPRTFLPTPPSMQLLRFMPGLPLYMRNPVRPRLTFRHRTRCIQCRNRLRLTSCRRTSSIRSY